VITTQMIFVLLFKFFDREARRHGDRSERDRSLFRRLLLKNWQTKVVWVVKTVF